MANVLSTLFNLLKKPLESVSDEVTTKFKTPFFTTFVVVWLFKNNLFIYNLFFNSSIKDKTELLKAQFNFDEMSFYIQSLKLVGVTLLIILVYYIVINISRIITMISEERIRINLLAYLKSKTITTKEDVEFWKVRAEDFKKKNHDLESEISTIRMNSDHYKNQLKEADKKLMQVNDSSDAHLNRMREILKDKLYLFMDVPEGISEDDLNIFKIRIDEELNRYKEELKPKKPSFLVS